jgi:hypothetical protein
MESGDDKAAFNTSKFSATTPPEVILEILIAELRRPIISIEGKAQVLSAIELREQHRDMWKSVAVTTSKMQMLLDMAEVYIEERRGHNPKSL